MDVTKIVSSSADEYQEFFVGDQAGRRYRLIKKIGSGAFGDIYHGVDTATGKKLVAVKLESTKAKHPQVIRYTILTCA